MGQLGNPENLNIPLLDIHTFGSGRKDIRNIENSSGHPPFASSLVLKRVIRSPTIERMLTNPVLPGLGGIFSRIVLLES